MLVNSMKSGTITDSYLAAMFEAYWKPNGATMPVSFCCFFSGIFNREKKITVNCTSTLFGLKFALKMPFDIEFNDLCRQN